MGKVLNIVGGLGLVVTGLTLLEIFSPHCSDLEVVIHGWAGGLCILVSLALLGIAKVIRLLERKQRAK